MMGSNTLNPPFAFLNVTGLSVTGDASPQANTPTTVTVNFELAPLFHNIFLQPTNWPFTVKVYAEGYGGGFVWRKGEVDRTL